jgi:hypothetical protein
MELQNLRLECLRLANSSTKTEDPGRDLTETIIQRAFEMYLFAVDASLDDTTSLFVCDECKEIEKSIN